MESKSRSDKGGAAAAVAVALALTLLLALAINAFRADVIFEGESAFGRVRVVEQSDGLRSLYIGDGRARQSSLYPGRPAHLEHAYTRVAMVGLALVSPDARMLFVGLGGGAMPMYTRHVLPQAVIDVVEIDPVVVDVAGRYFGFREDPRMTAHVADGRAFIEQAPPESYDVVFLDAFSDDEIPFALTTRQFLEAVRDALSRDGVVVSNLWTANPAYASMLATYHAVFDDVRLIRVRGHAQNILIAGARPLTRDVLIEAARTLAGRAELGFDLAALVADGFEQEAAPSAPVLEDADAQRPASEPHPP